MFSPRACARSLAVLLVLVLGPAAVARATQVQALDLRELVRQADHVVAVTALSEVSHLDHLDRIVTDTTVRVDESFRGGAPVGATLVLRKLGGVLGDLGLHVEGEASVGPGERVLLFARAFPADGVVRPVGMSQGVLPIRRAAGLDAVLPGGSGLALVQRGADGALRPAPGALASPVPADEIFSRVRDLVIEVHGTR